MRTPPRGPLLSDLPEPASRALAAHFAGTDNGLTSVDGPAAATTAFAHHYAGLVGAKPRRGSSMRLLRLDRVDPPTGVPGRSRPATPADRGRILDWLDAFSAETLGGELHDIGMTEDLLVELGAIYVRHFLALQADVHDMLAGHDRDWDHDQLVAIQRRLTENSKRMLPAIDRVLNYVHQRTVQRLTLDAVRTAAETGTGVGGVDVSGGC